MNLMRQFSQFFIAEKADFVSIRQTVPSHVTEKRSLHRGNMFHCFKYTTRRNKSELNFSRSTNN